MEGESWKGQGSHPQGEGYILRGPEGGRDAVRFAFYIQPGSEVKSLSRVRLFATPWTAACSAPLFMGFLQARLLEWVDMPSSRESSRPRD